MPKNETLVYQIVAKKQSSPKKVGSRVKRVGACAPNDQKFVAQSARIVQTLVEEGACRSEMVGLSVDFAFGPPLARMLTMQMYLHGATLLLWL